METLGNIYGNISQACRPKGKTYRDTQLGELVHSIVVERVSEKVKLLVNGSHLAPQGESRNIIMGMTTWSSRNTAPRETPSPLPGAPNVEAVLRYFHRCCYRSSPLWFFCWRGLRSLGRWLWTNTVGTKIDVIQAART
jgi:hypothetical protein